MCLAEAGIDTSVLRHIVYGLLQHLQPRTKGSQWMLFYRQQDGRQPQPLQHFTIEVVLSITGNHKQPLPRQCKTKINFYNRSLFFV